MTTDPDYDKKRTVSFSGHRLLSPPVQGSLFGGIPADGDFTEAVRGRLDTTLRTLVDRGFDTFLCGMATGFDLMAGRAVCDLMDKGVPLSLVAAIPFPGQADGFSEDDKTLFAHVLGRATASHVICPDYRPDSFHRRNDYLVENASVLLCFYNGSPGGTRYTIKKALSDGLEVINLCDF